MGLILVERNEQGGGGGVCEGFNIPEEEGLGLVFGSLLETFRWVQKIT